MTVTTPAISPLRQRMIDDMRLRKLADKTQSHHKFQVFFQNHR